MSTHIESAPWLPVRSWWVLLAPVIVAGLMGSWFIAAGLLVFLLINVARPFDFVAPLLVVMAGSAFVHYEGGNLMYELKLLSVAILAMLFCYVISSRNRMLSLPWTPLSQGLLMFLAWSVANFGRGVLAGYPLKNATTELLGVSALASALLVGNLFERRQHLHLAFAALLVTACGSAAIGFYVYAILHVRTAGIYFTSFPGIVGLFLLNLALRSRSTAQALGWVALSMPFFLHQFLSYRRALWLGCLVASIVTIAIYAGSGPRSGTRWRRTGLVFGTMVGLSLVGAIGMAVVYGQEDILKDAAGRFASIGSADFKAESRGDINPGTLSNVERLIEYSVLSGLILKSPWVGYGLGYNFIVKKPFLGPHVQWWAHQNYLLIWLKQGLIGLGLFLLLLWTAFRLGVREARRRTDPWESAWFAMTATATVFLAVFSLTDIPFAYVNATFMLALLWGGAIAMSKESDVTLRW